MGDPLRTASVEKTQPVETSATEAADGPFRAFLLVHEGGSSRVFALPPAGELVVGRSPAAGLQIEDASVSRLHARFRFEGGGAGIADLESHNGTRVNGERVAGERQLKHGDVIALGNVTLVYRREAAPLARAAALDAGELRRRLAEELERSRRYGRSFAIVAIEIGPRERGELMMKALADQLRTLDSFALDGEQLLVLLPETRADGVQSPIERLLHVLTPPARAGFAIFPADGLEPDVLLAAAKAAARAAAGGELAPATNAMATLVEVGGLQVVAAAPAMVQLYNVIRRLAASDMPVLIYGETGAGKEIAASALHHWSPRRAQKMLAVNCAALPETLIESELFGYERGAFSGADRPRAGLFEAAIGGTVFLDEVGELSAQAQAKLLRAVEMRRVSRLGSSEDREIDVRLVAATNRPLESEVKAGRFRQDLFFRLGAATLTVPPLRDRPQDLAVLARTFLERACAALGRPPLTLAPTTLKLLAAHGWPGNVRELKNTMDYLAATVTETVLEPDLLPPSIVQRPAERGPSREEAEVRETAPLGNLQEEIRQLERRRITEALEASGGVQVKAAELIGMPLRTFAGKVRLYGLSRK
jgi:DNA-binding NtrC family response regulator